MGEIQILSIPWEQALERYISHKTLQTRGTQEQPSHICCQFALVCLNMRTENYPRKVSATSSLLDFGILEAQEQVHLVRASLTAYGCTSPPPSNRQFGSEPTISRRTSRCHAGRHLYLCQSYRRWSSGAAPAIQRQCVDFGECKSLSSSQENYQE